MKATLNKKSKMYLFQERQKEIMREINQLKSKLAMLGSLERFENLAKKGRKFAKEKGIKAKDVIKND